MTIAPDLRSQRIIARHRMDSVYDWAEKHCREEHRSNVSLYSGLDCQTYLHVHFETKNSATAFLAQTVTCLEPLVEDRQNHIQATLPEFTLCLWYPTK